jgi:dihydroorotase
MNRRQFFQTAGAFPSLIAVRKPLSAATYDLVVHGGRVIDPAQRIDRVMDVAIRGGKVAALGPNIPVSSATDSIDATGKLVVPGLIDIHLHARDAALPPSAIMALGVTSMVDAGSRGADNVDQLIEVARTAPNRMRILLNIGRLGNNPNGRGEFLDNIDQADVAKARAAVKEHRNWIVGIKARLSRGIAAEHDAEVLRRAVQVAGPFGIPIMIHMGDTASPLPQILALLRPGDIVSHMYAPTPHGIMDQQGRILPEVREARRRGIRFDFGNGLNEHWNWDVAQSGLQQGFPPDTISTDLTIAGRTDQVTDLPNVVSKFLLMGMPLSQAIACVTSNAARSIREFRAYGSLRVGAAADVTVLELAQGDFSFVDNYKNVRMGTQRLVARNVIMGGISEPRTEHPV